ncbi:MAG: phosphatidate cytidylyltransferase [Rhodospirillaceae bacterium]
MIGAHLHPNVVATLGGVFGLLVFATLVVFLLGRARPERNYTELRLRVQSWWIIVGIVAVALALSDTAAIVFFGFVSFLAFKEYLSLIPTRRADRRVLLWAYLAIPAQYGWIADAWYGMFVIFIPVYVFLLLPFRMVVAGAVDGFLRAVGTLHWGLMTTVYSLSHIAFLLVLPGIAERGAGGAGLVVFLLILTELNDVAQYVWGKSLGRRRIVPTVSPNKTWEGFLGGVATTVVLAVMLAPVLTPFDGRGAVAAGFLIAVAGFVGDVTISALKRDLGVKDSGSLIPGHGGMLDRIDSLTFTAPLFLHFTRYFYS